MYIRASGSDTANRKNTRLRFNFKAWKKDLFLPRCEIRRASHRTASFSGEFFSFFSPLDYNSINSGKIPGAWIFVKLIVNLQLCRNKGNLPCFLFTNEYLSGGTFTRVGIILAIFPPDCNTSGRLERCFRRFERGSRISKFESNGSQIQRLFAFERVYWKNIFFF